MANKDKEFASIDKEVFAIAGLLDAQLRVAGLNAGEFSELEADYLKNWLNKEPVSYTHLTLPTKA